jgi:hypothetical protein
MVKRHRIALWDVLSSCERKGSLDKDIRAELANDIPRFVRRNPTMRTICLNGTTAERMFFKYHGKALERWRRENALNVHLLPSSSPVPRRFIRTFEDKLEKWRMLREFLEEREQPPRAGGTCAGGIRIGDSAGENEPALSRVRAASAKGPCGRPKRRGNAGQAPGAPSGEL